MALRAVAALLVAGWVVACHAAQKSNADKLPGWLGETYSVEATWDPLHLEKLDDLPLPRSESWIEHVAWHPRVFIYHNFITELEAKHMIELAAPQMKRSTVVGANGQSVEDNYRTSYGTFLKRYQDVVVERVENRVAAWTQIPVVHQEDTQILRYGIGQQYKVHADTLVDPEAGVRVATVLIYLNEPEVGGETAFPDSQWVDPSLATTHGANFSQCAQGHVAFAPKRGDALLFWSINPDGQSEDFHASHTGCPVISGVKWTATKWIHAKPFRAGEMAPGRRHEPYLRDPGVCYDESDSCAEWAARGDCEKNKDYMIVNAVSPGVCRKTCGACTVCAENDAACYNRNRENIGFLIFNSSELAPFHVV
ncbi:hypothetical protein HYH03_007903 [Edaphochlamys debaryana]|uniref:procollagen-proline 4-dioxygenase n=1 Tax=Edaphochlamys debaryana TaxID=47281 RepID=A0A836BYM0_9CHLO|nr:hypothetical protein HYH03_007903 [Edaphochlamys debaryana]|eukprot:KAG2493976.1 hypothetical protein HYH03_007903 [Edaphochlamys debaryana]